ncbi:MAG TPA: GMC oxidoreductase [Solirubrobacteraceae bacterium]|jgi:choline dehydrogenase-like flavoprotein
MAERVDVLIAGTGFGGSIAAFRLAEAYRAAGADPRAIVCLERGERFKHTDFRQAMHADHLSRVYRLVQGQGAQMVTATGVGGGSNLYLAASLRAPTETFERRDRRPGDGPERRMWPDAISRGSLDPYYARAETGLRIARPGWDQVSKSGGVWAAALHAAGHTCDRVPLAISPQRCVDAKWCHTGCVFGAKNTLPTNYLGAAEALGVQVRPGHEVQSVKPSSARPWRYLVTVKTAGGTVEIECKVCILATGAMNDAPILLRSQRDLPSLSEHVGRHLGCNGDHIAAVELNPGKVRELLGLPGYAEFHKGKPITTMSYDFWVGRRGPRYDGTRFNLQEIFLSSLTSFLYDDGREPAGEPSFWGLQKKDAIAHWANRIELLAMVEDTHDGTFLAPSPTGGGAVSPSGGPIEVGTFSYAMSDQSIAVREAANAAMKRIAERRGLGRFMALTETRGVYAAHPLGGCRMAASKDLGVTDDRGAVFDHEGLYCFGSAIIPTSLGVNPSLTIAAVAERAADGLVASMGDLGLPAPAAAHRPQTPREEVGERVVPSWSPPRRLKRLRRRDRLRRRRARRRAHHRRHRRAA